MKVTRKDIFDFALTLTEDEFNDIKVVSDFDKTPIEDVLDDLLEYGLNVLRNGIDSKET